MASGSILLRKIIFKMKYLLKVLLVCAVIFLPVLMSTSGLVIIAVAAVYDSPFVIFLPKTSNEISAEAILLIQTTCKINQKLCL